MLHAGRRRQLSPLAQLAAPQPLLVADSYNGPQRVKPQEQPLNHKIDNTRVDEALSWTHLHISLDHYKH